MRLFVPLVVLLTLFATPQQLISGAPQQIHALVAIDTLSNLRFSSTQDGMNIKQALEYISLSTGLKVNLKMLAGKNLTQKKISGWMEKLKKNSNDIVIFYYSGHGHKSENNHWPNICLSDGRTSIPASRITKAVHKTIRPRLAIMLYDCCNHDPFVHSAHQFKGPQLFTTKSPIHPGMTKLFIQSRGLIIASGCIPGQKSMASERGGIFTFVLIKKLMEETDRPDASWKRVFSSTRDMCERIQTPQFKILLK